MVTVLEDVAFRVDGLRFLEQLGGSRADVVLDLSACSVAQGMWALPAIDAIAAQLPAARLGVRAGDDLSALLVAHLRAQRLKDVRRDPPGDALVIELSPRFAMRPRLVREGERRRLLRVPSRPFPKRSQHAWGHWVDGVRACGFDARAARPKLLLRDRAAARTARTWLRERFGRRGRTLIALLPSATEPSWGVERFAHVGRELERRLGATLLCHAIRVPGATPFDDLDIVTAAHVLAVVAVAIGDADGLAARRGIARGERRGLRARSGHLGGALPLPGAARRVPCVHRPRARGERRGAARRTALALGSPRAGGHRAPSRAPARVSPGDHPCCV